MRRQQLQYMMASRLAIFIDGANMDRASEDTGIRIHYGRLKTFLQGNRLIVFANYYNSKPSDLGELAFYSRLQNVGYKLVLGPKRVPDRSQKEVDVQIAVDMVSGAYTDLFDIALLASGDGDFVPIVKKMRSMNKSAEVASFEKQLSMSLRTAASRVIDLTSNIKQFKN